MAVLAHQETSSDRTFVLPLLKQVRVIVQFCPYLMGFSACLPTAHYFRVLPICDENFRVLPNGCGS
jgi:hypothetical protein